MIATSPSILRLFVAGSMALVVGACSWVGSWRSDQTSDLLPRDEGLYALSGTQLVRLDGDPEWEVATWDERSNLDPGVQFVIYHSALGQLERSIEDAVRLQKVVWVRSHISADGSIKPVEGERWSVSDLERFAVPLEFRPIEGRGDAVQAIPLEQLGPGLYSLRLATSAADLNSRLGVAWPYIDRQSYSAATCVDRYVDTATTYRPCSDQTRVFSTEGLALYLVDPEVQSTLNGRTMVIQGVVVNTTDQRRRVPPMEGHLRTMDGRPLHQWQFNPAITELEPGESAAFRTEVRNPPEETHDVHVTFAMLDR